MRVVIIGAGQAAAQTIQSLRQGGFDGSISLIGAELAPPYQRPPLSKAFLKGEMAEDRLYLRPLSWYADQKIDVNLGVRAVAVDRAARRVALSDGGRAEYDRLVFATGARPRRLDVPGAELPGIFDLRTIADVEHIRPRLIEGRCVVIIGAGYIGLEAAAVARQMDLDVAVVEMADRVLARVTGPFMSDYYRTIHEKAGVRIMLNARLTAFEQGERTGLRAVLAGGETIEADTVLVGIGILPDTDMAAAAGLEHQDGVVVDEDARTSDPDIFAVGDCTRRPLFPYGRAGRLESVHNAIEQGKQAAAAILGRPRPRPETPWFWSDQYDLKLQIAGLSAGYDDYVVRGDPATGAFAVFYLRDGVLVAVDAVNSPKEFLGSKRLIAEQARPDRARLADVSVDMRDFA